MIRANLGGKVTFDAVITGTGSSDHKTGTFTGLPASAKYAIVVAQTYTTHVWAFVDLINEVCINLDITMPGTVSATYSNGTLVVTSSEAGMETGSDLNCYPISGDVDYSAIVPAP